MFVDAMMKTKMSCWIRLSKVLESDLWDVVATGMTGGALTWMNGKFRVVKELHVQPWPTCKSLLRP